MPADTRTTTATTFPDRLPAVLALLACALLLVPVLCRADIEFRDIQVIEAMADGATVAGDITITTADGRTRYDIGEQIVFELRADKQDWYVTFFDIQTSGSVVVILPNRYSSGILLRARQTRQVPGPGDGFRYRIAGPPGTERIIVVGTSKPISLTPEDLAQYASGRALFRTVRAGDRSKFLRRVRDILTEQAQDVPGFEYTVAQLTIQIGKSAPGKWAVIVGIEKYPSNPLRFAVDDARAFYSEGSSLMNIPSDHCILLLDEEATVAAFREAVRRIARQAGPDDAVYIFFSGHGGYTSDQDGDEQDDHLDEYLVFHDDVLLDDDFAQLMQSVRVRLKALLLDSCFSGGAARGVRCISPAREVSYRGFGEAFFIQELRQRGTREPALPEGVVLLAASQPDQPSWEDERISHGVFTYFLLKGLRGPADSDRDGSITFQEMRDWLNRHIPDYVLTIPSNTEQRRQHAFLAGSVPGNATLRP